MTRKAITLLLFLFAGLACLAAGAAGESPAVESDLFFTDSYGRQVEIPADLERVISLGPNMSELIFALDAGDLLVGRTDYCDYPEEIFSVPSVGTITDPNIESVIELEPDLVIGSTHTPQGVLERIEKAGITTVGIYTDQRFEGIYETIADTGFILDREHTSGKLIASMKDEIAGIEQAVAGLPRPTVYYVVGFGEWGDFTAGGDTFINEIITAAGGDNIASDVNGWSYSLEKIIENDPDIIIVPEAYDSKKIFASSPGYRDLRAVREGNLYAINNDLIDRQGVRNAAGMRVLAEIFHPGSL